MNKAIIRFSSITYALMAKNIIENYGGNVKVEKSQNNFGCGYKIILNCNIKKHINLIKKNNIKYIGIDYL